MPHTHSGEGTFGETLETSKNQGKIFTVCVINEGRMKGMQNCHKGPLVLITVNRGTSNDPGNLTQRIVENPGISCSDILILIPDSRTVYDLIFTLFILLITR